MAARGDSVFSYLMNATGDLIKRCAFTGSPYLENIFSSCSLVRSGDRLPTYRPMNPSRFVAEPGDGVRLLLLLVLALLLLVLWVEFEDVDEEDKLVLGLAWVL